MKETAESFQGPGDLRSSKKADRAVERAQGSVFQINGETLGSNQVMELICREVSNGQSLVNVCKLPGFPATRQVAVWMRNEPVFKKAYEEAEEVRAIFLAEEALEEADSAEGKEGRNDASAVKLRVEVRKWLAGKLNRRYSDRQVIEHLHELELKSEDELRAILIAGIESDPKIISMLDHKSLERVGLTFSGQSQIGDRSDSDLSPEPEDVEIVIEEEDDDA